MKKANVKRNKETRKPFNRNAGFETIDFQSLLRLSILLGVSMMGIERKESRDLIADCCYDAA